MNDVDITGASYPVNQCAARGRRLLGSTGRRVGKQERTGVGGKRLPLVFLTTDPAWQDIVLHSSLHFTEGFPGSPFACPSLE